MFIGEKKIARPFRWGIVADAARAAAANDAPTEGSCDLLFTDKHKNAPLSF